MRVIFNLKFLIFNNGFLRKIRYIRTCSVMKSFQNFNDLNIHFKFRIVNFKFSVSSYIKLLFKALNLSTLKLNNGDTKRCTK